MDTRAYLSNLSPRLWPLAKQEALHAEKTPGWPDISVYRDELSRRARVGHSAEALNERKAMLQKTSRRPGAEVIYVASLAVLAWTAEDFMRCVAAASARHAAIVAHDTGRRIEPTDGAAALQAAVSEFLGARRVDQTGEARKIGSAAAKVKREADTKARVALIAEDWRAGVVPTKELLLRAGRKPAGRRQVVPMAYKTAAQELEARPKAIKQAQAGAKRAAAHAAKKEADKP